MRFKWAMLAAMVLLAILTIGASSAAQDESPISNETQEIPIGNEADGDVLSEISISNFEDGDEFEIGVDGENDIYVDIDSEEDIEGRLSVYIDGNLASLKDYNDEEGYFYIVNEGMGAPVVIDEDHDPSLCIDRLSPGTYLMRIVFTGPSSEFSIDQTANITVKRAGEVTSIGIELADDDRYVAGNPKNAINITAPANIIDRLTISINGQTYPLKKISSTKGYVNISRLEPNFYTITVKAGTLSEDASFEVIEGESSQIAGNISYPQGDIIYGSNQYISITLPENATGNLVIEDGEGYTLFDEALQDGYAAYSLANLSMGNYELSAYYTGLDYDVSSQEIHISVIPQITMPSVMTVGQKKFITIGFAKKVTCTVRMLVDAQYYTSAKVINANTTSISLAGLDDGIFDITLEIRSNAFSYDYEGLIEILEVRPRISGASNINMNYGTAGYYKFTVYGTNGKPAEEDEYVEIMIGKWSFDTFTNSRGVVMFRIPDSIAPGKYSISANYNDVAYSKNVLVVKHTLKMKKVKVRASAKKLVIKAYLKKGMKNKEIILKFKGKKYRALTNKKGVAKFKIKNKVLKKLKPGKKVTYQATYLKDMVKYTVKVKK